MKLSRCWVGVALVVLACGDDDGGAKPSGDGGTSNPRDGAVTDQDRDAGDSCNASLDDTPGTCTKAEYASYSQCLLKDCDSHYKKCLGSDYKNGNFAGTCGTYFKCLDACGCDPDLACVTACGTPNADCTACLQDMSCAADCGDEPACAGSFDDTPDAGAGDAGSGATCETLQDCCDSLTDAQDKSDCLGVLGNAQMIPSAADQFCSVSVMSYRSVGKCQ